ncbi:hypothetical protein GCM10010178_00950 [Lentzea flava]|uniref:Uncharacterized protein n=2 Tax=Lentzea flava TaxID=103732 RepID=A0ABQ2UBX1_9PSEU|nr:hypothetical protein GCM10010178_00950 [Lentzea flava]
MDEQGMSNLERRYRWLLRVLPKWYRQDREEEMVGIFLADRTDDLDLEHSWPGWGETGAILGLAVRTHLAAGAALTSVPARVMWRGEVVRVLGMIGLLLGVFYAGAAITNLSVAYGNPEWAQPISWWRLLELAPIVAFAALLNGRRTPAKIAAFAPVVLTVATLAQTGGHVVLWVLFQLPGIVTFLCLCLGFHREAPTPPARRLLWWGGGALLLGVLGGFATGTGLLAIALITVVVRVVAFVRGDFVLGRAVSLFALLQLAPLAFLLVGGEVLVIVLPLAVLLVLCAVAPVRKPSARPRVS